MLQATDRFSAKVDHLNYDRMAEQSAVASCLVQFAPPQYCLMVSASMTAANITYLDACCTVMIVKQPLLSSSLLANFRAEHCRTDDLMPNVPISCLPPSRVDPKVQGLKVIINCPQPDTSWATYRPHPVSRWQGLLRRGMELHLELGGNFGLAGGFIN